MKLFKKCLSYVLLGGAVAAAVLMPIRAASADTSVDWMNPNAMVETTRDPDASAECDYEYVTHTVEYPWLNRGQPTLTEKACVSKGKDLDVAWSLYGEQYVRFHSDSVYRLLYAESTVRIEKDSNFASYIRNTSDFRLVTVADLSVSLSVEKTNDLGEVVAYRVRPDSLTLQLSVAGEDGVYNHVYSYQISSDRRYLAAYVNYMGVVRVDLQTGEVTKVALFPGSANYRRDAPTVEGISDDGRYVFMGRTSSVIDTDGCGELLVGQFNDYSPISNECPTQSFSSLVSQQVPFTYRYSEVHFIDDGYGIEYLATLDGNAPAGVDVTPIHVTIHANGYDPSTTRHLKYLALGDSYSSGEGDINDDMFGDWYTDGTDGPNECHLSIRSYPYLLRDYWGIDINDMKSVACSGAKVLPDFYGGGNYFGQHNEYIGVNGSERDVAQSKAIELFKPGKSRQIDFVDKYKPDILTFTGGGNDIGFADIIEYCASSYKFLGFLPVDETCGYANNLEMRADLDRTINDQYKINKEFIERVKRVSPMTKIYMIGYPQFITDTDTCQNFSPILDIFERIMIHEEVARFNNVLKKVAQDTGIRYIDIENSLAGGRICEGSKYVTGPVKTIVKNGSLAKDSNMYHPNADGHKQIADTINRKIDTEDDYVIADVPSEVSGSKIVKQAILPDYVGLGSTQIVEANPGVFEPNGLLKIEMFSDRIVLANVTAYNDGSVKAKVRIPNSAGIGVHLLSLVGQGVDGEITKIQQFINVTSDIPGDIDADGIPDSIDNCFILTQWYISGENICLTSTINIKGDTLGKQTVGSTDQYSGIYKHEITNTSFIRSSIEDEGVGINTSIFNTNKTKYNTTGKSEPMHLEIWQTLSIIVIVTIGSLIYVRTKSSQK